MVATHAVVAKNNGFYHISQSKIIVTFNDRIHEFLIGMPVAVASPRIERAMVATFLNGIEHIVIFNNVTAPGTFAHIDTGTWHIVNGVMAYRNTLAHGEFHSSRLFFHDAEVKHEVVIDLTICRIVICFRSRSAVNLRQGHVLPILETWRAYRIRIANEAKGTGSDFGNQAARNFAIAVVIIEKDSVASQICERTIFKRTIYCAIV